MLLTFLYKSYELCVEDTVVFPTHQYSIIHDIHLNETITKAFIYLGFTNTGSNVLSTTHTLHAAFIFLGHNIRSPFLYSSSYLLTHLHRKASSKVGQSSFKNSPFQKFAAIQ